MDALFLHSYARIYDSRRIMAEHDSLPTGSDMSAQASPQQGTSDTASEYAALRFVITQMINRLATITLVQVLTVTNAGGVAPVGAVSVQPLVNQVNGKGQSVPHGIINNVPYFRLQGGANAVIIDPQVGDIGLCAFCSRDISAVKSSKAQANPASLRSYDWADALYLGAFLGGAPTQYVQFNANGINITSPTAITLTAPQVTINASTGVDVNTPLASFSEDIAVANDMS